MLRESLKQEIDNLSESQLRKIADFVALLKTQSQPQSQPLPTTVPLWRRATPTERAEDFRTWTTQLSKVYVSLPDQAFDRGSLYD